MIAGFLHGLAFGLGLLIAGIFTALLAFLSLWRLARWAKKRSHRIGEINFNAVNIEKPEAEPFDEFWPTAVKRLREIPLKERQRVLKAVWFEVVQKETGRGVN